MLQRATHHAGTRLDVVETGRAFTQFGESEIGLFLGLGTDEFRTPLEGTARAVDLGWSGHLFGLPLPMQPFLDRRQADPEGGGNDALGRFTCFCGSNDAFA